jgi:beta-lactam-binding protein with PASTA domain
VLADEIHAPLVLDGATHTPWLELSEAEQKLEARGFKVEVKRVASTKPKGIVLDQDPAAGVTALSGTTVTLSVSSGAKSVVVPRVVGQTQGDAVQALTALGLKPVLQNVPSDKPAGTVVGQKPPAGKEVDKGAEVTVNVSTGSACYDDYDTRRTSSRRRASRSRMWWDCRRRLRSRASPRRA